MSAAREEPLAVESGFAPDADGARWAYVGELTSANAGTVLAAAAALKLPGAGEVDLRDLEAIDSAAVAVLLALKRRAADEGQPLRFVGIPASLASLADLYGVEEILGA
jgi:phospholipid transport system transporter-binding protein